MLELTDNEIQLFKETAKRFTGSDRRFFQAQVTNVYLDGEPWKAEKVFGWGRKTVALGLKELETGYICYVEIHERGNKKTEDKLLNLENDIKDLVEPDTQVDPKFQTPLNYTKKTAKAVRRALIETKGYSDEELPTERTINTILNRLGYTLKRVQKTKPQKKIEETDAIFDNVHEINKLADDDK
jgi:Rhodopirellula transposase DDE domain